MAQPKKVDITIHDLSKVEGHADLDLKIRDGKVKEVKLKLTDNKRFFTQAIEGKSVDMLAQSTSRICGTCSIAHMMGCIECIEHALDVKISKQTELLKKLTIYGMYIRDHALHIYLFTLPDVFNKDSVLDFEGEEAEYLKDSFVIKRAGNKLTQVVAGRAVHAPYPVVGGFAQVPTKKDLLALIPELEDARKRTLKVLEVYANANIDYTRDTNFAALDSKEFNFLDGNIVSTKGLQIPESKYYDFLEKVAIPYSQATGYTFEGGNYMVGALARLNLNKKNLHKNTKKDCKKYLALFPSNNIFLNNLAQGIEIIHSIDHSIDIIKNNTFKKEAAPKLTYKDAEGYSVTEAPRGLLFYRLKINKDGTVENGTIITPTQQNQINMEADIKNLVEKTLKNTKNQKAQKAQKTQKDFDKDAMTLEIEKLIRSYDPCISCATHFLKVNWK